MDVSDSLAAGTTQPVNGNQNTHIFDELVEGRGPPIVGASVGPQCLRRELLPHLFIAAVAASKEGKPTRKAAHAVNRDGAHNIGIRPMEVPNGGHQHS